MRTLIWGKTFARAFKRTVKKYPGLRKDIEETENAVEEEISYLTGKHVVQLICSYGGYIPSTFKSIEIFTLDKFAKWVVQEQHKDLLLQCIDNLEIK